MDAVWIVGKYDKHYGTEVVAVAASRQDAVDLVMSAHAEGDWKVMGGDEVGFVIVGRVKANSEGFRYTATVTYHLFKQQVGTIKPPVAALRPVTEARR